MNSARVSGIEQHDADVDLVERRRQPRRGGMMLLLPGERVDPFLPQQAGDDGGAGRGRRQQPHARQIRNVVAGHRAMIEKEHRRAATAIAALIRPEAMPLIEAASATMQTNNGAGLGTATKCRSTMKAINAVAAVKAGPEIARQSNCMPVSVVRQQTIRAAVCPIVSIAAGFLCAVLKKALPGCGRLSRFLNQMNRNGWNRVPRPVVSAGKIQEDRCRRFPPRSCRS